MNIIVRGTNWIGDSVMQIPALRRLRGAFPDSRITLCTRPWARGIYEDADFIDDILEVNAGESTLSQSRKWRNGKFDLAILFTNSFQSALVAKFGKAKKRYGYSNEGRGFLLSNPVPKPSWKSERHESQYYLNLITEIEKDYFGESKDSNFEYKIGLSQRRKEKARKILRENGADLSKKIITFCPGSTNSRAKRWQGYHELNDLIQSGLNANIILIGDKSEIEVSDELFKKAKVKPIVLTGKTSLSEVVAILGVSNLVVSNDTGPAHIAAALEIETIVIFGPTDHKTTTPFNASIIRKNVECSPCMLRDCPIDHRCMAQISADEVFEMVKERLK